MRSKGACVHLCVKLRERKREGKEVGAGRYHNAPLNPLRIWRVGQTWPARPNEMVRGGVRGGSMQNNPFSVLCWACFLRAQLDNSHRSHVCAGRKGKSSKKHTGSLSHTNTQEKKKKEKKKPHSVVPLRSTTSYVNTSNKKHTSSWRVLKLLSSLKGLTWNNYSSGSQFVKCPLPLVLSRLSCSNYRWKPEL